MRMAETKPFDLNCRLSFVKTKVQRLGREVAHKHNSAAPSTMTR